MTRSSIRTWVIRLAVGGAAALLLAALGADRLLGRDVLLIAPHDAAAVKLNRALYLPGDPVADVYGNPLSRPVRVVILSNRGLIRPPEDPKQILLAVDGAKGDHPLQVQTVWFVTRYVVAALLAIAAVTAVTRRRQRVPSIFSFPQ
jgi:hypothetical protein